MGCEWLETRVQGIAAPSRNAIVGGPFGSDLVSRDYTPTGVPVIRGQNMGQRWVLGEFAFVSEAKARSLEANLARPGDIIFTQRGTLGQVSIVPAGAFDRYLISQSQMKLTVDREIADPLFFYYVFLTAEQQDYIRQHAIQTGVPHTNLGILRRTPLPLPPLSDQRAIAYILGTLDDKIELNRRMNETLEAMARALFKSWFVDFDPVRAKAQGRSSGLPQQFANFFPKSFETSELGVTPKGWRVASIGELCRRVAMGPFGSDIKTDNFVEAGVPIVRGSNLTDGFVENAFVFLTEQKADELRNANAFPGDIVITHRGTLGQVGLIPQNSRFPRYVVSQSQMLLAVDQGHSTPRYIFDFLRSPIGQHALLANTSQTGVPAIARPTTSVKAIRLLAPPIQVLIAFDQLANPIYRRRDYSIRESRTLAALRDTLLPKLISGELRVKAAEKMVEAVA